mmetsp:Transcript_13916/g.41914  ORF Transcript_13916/g.41914 Transcript_13916/m.41914 type:complete len:380 (-) Transcript_13916:39-1178(-)
MADNTLNVLPGSTDFEKLEYLCKRTFKAQAVWFLNATWNTIGQQEAENLWNYVHKAQEIDIDHKEQGTHLDELQAHRLLESFDETMTVREMRTYLRQHGAIGDRVKSVPLTHWWIAKYGEDWEKLVNASQGDNREEIEKAQAMVDEMNAAFEDADAKAQVAAAALREAQAREAESVAAAQAAKAAEDEAKAREQDAVAREQEALAREADAREAEAPFKAAQEELEAALAEMKAQEDAYNNKTAELKQQSEEGGVVSRNRAKVQLDAHLAEDPLPLRRAKITQEAAVKKAERATKAAAEATAASEAAAAEAAKATQRSLDAKQAAEDAVQAAHVEVKAAEDYLQEVKSKPGQAFGAIWWIERELIEAKKYMPTSKGGIAK